jgi:hypothetical protein
MSIDLDDLDPVGMWARRGFGIVEGKCSVHRTALRGAPGHGQVLVYAARVEDSRDRSEVSHRDLLTEGRCVKEDRWGHPIDLEEYPIDIAGGGGADLERGIGYPADTLVLLVERERPEGPDRAVLNP